jgi:hypothetical protein
MTFVKLRRPSSVDHRKLAAAISSTLRLEGLSISQHPIDLENPPAAADFAEEAQRNFR